MNAEASPSRARQLYVRSRSRAFAIAKEVLYAAVRWSGAGWIARRASAGKVGIVLYHNPSPQTFAHHLRYLARTSTFISLDNLVDAIERKDWSTIPPRSVVVTIDDGHADNRLLLELLARYRVRPTIYLCSQIVGTRRRYWWTAVGAHVRRALSELPNGERLRRLRDEFGFSQTGENHVRHALSWTEIGEMIEQVDFGAHTRFHPLLTQCEDAECRTEITGSRHELEELTGQPCRHFAYPNGVYGEREVAAVRDAGFASARTTEIGLNNVETDRYRLKILGIPDDASVNALAAQLAAIPYLRDLIFLR